MLPRSEKLRYKISMVFELCFELYVNIKLKELKMGCLSLEMETAAFISLLNSELCTI